MLKVGDSVRFLYHEITGDGKRGVNEYSGYVTRVYRNGQFTVADPTGMNPTRFELSAVLIDRPV